MSNDGIAERISALSYLLAMLTFCNSCDAQYIFIPKMGVPREIIVPFGLLVR
jgi:hypothetical protein